MSKNPFQILDFLGYFFPGATVMIALYYYVSGIRDFISFTTDTSAIIYIVCIIIAYIIGHIVSLLSSITVEKYAVWKYGYPSEYLLYDYKPNMYFSRSTIYDTSSLSNGRRSFLNITKKFLKVLIWILLLPVSLLDTILSGLFGIDYFFTRKLSERQIQMIKEKCIILFKNIGISVELDKLFVGDNHRIVHNYYFENANKHSVRMENCIAIYDFLRAMTFVMCVVFMVVFFNALLTINFQQSIDWNLCGLLVVLAILSYVLYMGFHKFFRKFTIENFMCLICDKNLDFPKKKESVLYTKAGVQLLTDNQGFTFNN